MGKRSTFRGYIRQVGAGTRKSVATPVPVPSVLVLSFPANQAAGTPTEKVLPKGARVIETVYNGAGTGGTTPTFNIGYDGAPGAIVTDGDADGGLLRVIALSAPLTADAEVLAGAGAVTPATGGTITAAIHYVMDDDGAFND